MKLYETQSEINQMLLNAIISFVIQREFYALD